MRRKAKGLTAAKGRKVPPAAPPSLICVSPRTVMIRTTICAFKPVTPKEVPLGL